jgi:hypothetical protein
MWTLPSALANRIVLFCHAGRGGEAARRAPPGEIVYDPPLGLRAACVGTNDPGRIVAKEYALL